MSSQLRVPIKDARNLGPKTADELEALDIFFLDQLEKMGWEESCILWAENFPHRLNLNAFTAIIGAIEDQDWRQIDSDLKRQAKQLVHRLKSGNF